MGPWLPLPIRAPPDFPGRVLRLGGRQFVAELGEAQERVGQGLRATQHARERLLSVHSSSRGRGRNGMAATSAGASHAAAGKANGLPMRMRCCSCCMDRLFKHTIESLLPAHAHAGHREDPSPTSTATDSSVLATSQHRREPSGEARRQAGMYPWLSRQASWYSTYSRHSSAGTAEGQKLQRLLEWRRDGSCGGRGDDRSGSGGGSSSTSRRWPAACPLWGPARCLQPRPTSVDAPASS